MLVLLRVFLFWNNISIRLIRCSHIISMFFISCLRSSLLSSNFLLFFPVLSTVVSLCKELEWCVGLRRVLLRGEFVIDEQMVFNFVRSIAKKIYLTLYLGRISHCFGKNMHVRFFLQIWTFVLNFLLKRFLRDKRYWNLVNTCTLIVW